MNDREMMDFLATRINYERKGMPANTELRLDRILMLLEKLGRPDRNYPIVHIAGTKGKGTTAHLVAAMLEAAGDRVGLHTSPHFFRLEERFRINGKEGDSRKLARLLDHLKPMIAEFDEKLEPEQPALTFFEITTAMVLTYFADEKVDSAVIEVGMGGRLDSTNVVEPKVAVITSISRDHMKQLGDTVDQIAAEKAGIIKPGVPVVSGVTNEPAASVIRDIAHERRSPLFEIDRDFSVRSNGTGLAGSSISVKTMRSDWPTFALPLAGQHQTHNAALALAAIELLESTRKQPFERPSLVRSLERVSVPGRVQVVQTKPTIVFDVAHNEASIRSLVDTLTAPTDSGGSQQDWKKKIALVSIARDKDWEMMIETLGRFFDCLVVTNFLSNPRSLEAEVLAETARLYCDDVRLAKDPADAWRISLALAESAPHDVADTLLVVTGSFFLVAEIQAIRLGMQNPSAAVIP